MKSIGEIKRINSTIQELCSDLSGSLLAVKLGSEKR